MELINWKERAKRITPKASIVQYFSPWEWTIGSALMLGSSMAMLGVDIRVGSLLLTFGLGVMMIISHRMNRTYEYLNHLEKELRV